MALFGNGAEDADFLPPDDPAAVILEPQPENEPKPNSKSKPPSKRRPFKKRAQLFTCPVCNAIVKYKSNFKRHMERVHGPKVKRAACTVCRKRFSDVYELRRHKKTVTHLKLMKDASTKTVRTVNGPYECSVCRCSFTSKRALERHKHDEKPRVLPCDLCGRKFQTSVVCAAHRRRHFWRGLPRCRACGATFASEVHLSRHIGNHKNETTEVVRY